MLELASGRERVLEGVGIGGEVAALDPDRGQAPARRPPRQLSQDRALADPPGTVHEDDADGLGGQQPLEGLELGLSPDEARGVFARETRAQGRAHADASPHRLRLSPYFEPASA